jgi:hypothetical protein
MTKITDALHDLINNAIIKQRGEIPVRSYMGASGLGVECQRSLWYSFFKTLPIDNPVTLRKFDVGNAFEPIVNKWLSDAGLTLFSTSSDGKQFGFSDGLLGGNCDGVIKGIPGDENTPYLLEIKTSNGFYFKQFVKDGIGCNDKYKGQVQIYMNKLRLKKCLFVVVNKDSQELYLEIVDYDEFEALRLIERGHQTSKMISEPERHYENKMNFHCKMCTYYKECWK